MADTSYIIIESDNTDKDVAPHTENEEASAHTMHNHGIFIEKEHLDETEKLPGKQATQELLAQNGIEIMHKPDGEDVKFDE